MKLNDLTELRETRRHDVQKLTQERAKMVERHEHELAEKDAELAEHQAVLDELDEFFAWKEAGS